MRQATSGIARTDLAAHLDAVAVGESDVEHRDVGTGRRDAAERRCRGVGLADHLDVVLGLEQLAHAAPNDLVVVEQEDADRVGVGRHGVSVSGSLSG